MNKKPNQTGKNGIRQENSGSEANRIYCINEAEAIVLQTIASASFFEYKKDKQEFIGE